MGLRAGTALLLAERATGSRREVPNMNVNRRTLHPMSPHRLEATGRDRMRIWQTPHL